MPKVTTTIEFDWAAIVQCLEEKTGRKLENPQFDIESNGDPDRGTWEQKLRSVSFETTSQEKLHSE